MAYVVNATWITTPARATTVRAALVELAIASRAEPGNRAYVPYEDPERPATFGIFEVYEDERAFQAHLDSAHFGRVLEHTIPLLTERSRHAYRTIEAQITVAPPSATSSMPLT
jgi:quinol monooxygenase YgiN